MEKRKRKTPAKGKVSIVLAASLTYALRGYKVVTESWQDARLQGKWRKEKKTRAEGKVSRAPATSLTYALHGYKIVTESQQDARLQDKWRKETKKTLAEGKQV